MNFVDIHSHILPAMDDGARTLEDSVAMLRMAAEDGTTDIVATPHANQEYLFDPEAIERKIAEVQMAAGPQPRIHRGCDFHLTLENIKDALRSPGKYAINHHCYLLVEFSDVLIPRATQQIFDRLQDAGLVPVVTHPERNLLLHTRLDHLQSWVENGALVQITAQSLLGNFGRAAKSAAVELMDRDLVHFIASDAHDATHRPPLLSAAYARVAKTWGHDRAETLFVIAPKAAILGEPVSRPCAQPDSGKRRWYRLGFH